MKTVIDVCTVTIACFLVGHKLGFGAVEAGVFTGSVSWLYMRCVKEKA